jgi:hypothetical protein
VSGGILRRASDTCYDQTSHSQCNVAERSHRASDTSQTVIALSRQCKGAELSNLASDTSECLCARVVLWSFTCRHSWELLSITR